MASEPTKLQEYNFHNYKKWENKSATSEKSIFP